MLTVIRRLELRAAAGMGCLGASQLPTYMLSLITAHFQSLVLAPLLYTTRVCWGMGNISYFGLVVCGPSVEEQRQL